MLLLNDFLDKLPVNNRTPVKSMLEILSEDDLEFIEDSLINGRTVPGNIVTRINEAFKIAGYPGFTWDNCRTEFYSGRFDFS